MPGRAPPVAGIAGWVGRVQARFVVLFPTGAVDQQVAEVLGDGAHELLAQDAHAVDLLDDLVIAPVFQDPVFERRGQVDRDAGFCLRAPQAIHPEVGVGSFPD